MTKKKKKAIASKNGTTIVVKKFVRVFIKTWIVCACDTNGKKSTVRVVKKRA